MRKKTIAKRPPREKILKRSSKPSTRSQDQTFTPSPSPPTSPPRCDPMARTKNTPRFPASAKPTPPPKVTPSKPGSSKPGSSKPNSSKGKRPAVEEPVFEPTQPKSRFKSTINNDFYEGVIQYRIMCPSFLANLPSLKRKVKWDEGVGISYNDTLAHICEYPKGPSRSERVVLDDEDDDFVPEESSSLSTEGTSISTGKKSTLLNVVKDVVQEFVSQSNHMIAMSKEQRKLASKHENFLKKSRDRVAVFMTFIDNLQKDEDPATDGEDEADSEGNGSDA
ncbi:swi5-dependent recombination DNA repair protein 1 homolog [Arachis ipaensis]|uniref:swi5-dependent recombination DNA repair protein 1 homolog n=1 Tax=Arachis ipaensis TaxID=130454 RepID=UPI0007AF2B24|nr:swi5-dependent recombination DNA repair protein 1 homolog [Arachis ipaensis]